VGDEDFMKQLTRALLFAILVTLWISIILWTAVRAIETPNLGTVSALVIAVLFFTTILYWYFSVGD
jgi:hypothetical protein